MRENNQFYFHSFFDADQWAAKFMFSTAALKDSARKRFIVSIVRLQADSSLGGHAEESRRSTAYISFLLYFIPVSINPLLFFGGVAEFFLIQANKKRKI